MACEGRDSLLIRFYQFIVDAQKFTSCQLPLFNFLLPSLFLFLFFLAPTLQP